LHKKMPVLQTIVMLAPLRATRRACLRHAQEGGRMAAARASIHDFFVSGGEKKTWMVGTRPTMTIQCLNRGKIKFAEER
jgi:hypothetical protein